MRLRLTLRGLLRAPAFALASVGTIALAVSLSTTVFAVVDGVLFKPLPYPEAADLFFLEGQPVERRSGVLAAADLQLLRDAAPDASFTAYGGGWSRQLVDRPDVVIRGMNVDSAFFDVLGRHPLVGGFSPEDFARPADSAEPESAIVSFAFWRQHLGANPDVLGQVIALSHSGIRIAGVLPADLALPSQRGERTDLLLAAPAEWTSRPGRWLRTWDVIVRVDADGADAAQARFDAVFAAHRPSYGPPPREGMRPYDRVSMRPLAEHMGAGDRPFFGAAFAVTACLVLLACVNVTALLLSRTRARARELRVRATLGASRRDIGALVVSEVIVLTLVGAALGFAAAHPLLAAALHRLPDGVDLLQSGAIDWRVALFAFVLPLTVMMLLAIVPVRRAFLDMPVASMAAGSTLPARGIAGSGLLALECGFGMVLFAAGTLMLASFAGLRAEPSGFREDGLVLVDFMVRANQDAETARAAIQDRAVARLKSVPGVDDAAIFGGSLLENLYSALALDMPTRTPDAWVAEVPVSPSFYDVAGLRLLEGRVPTRAEIDGAAPVAVLSRLAARDLWGDEPALGRVVKGNRFDGHSYEVIGIVEDVRMASQREGTRGEAFTPIRNSGRWYAAYIARTTDDEERVAARIREAFARDASAGGADVIVERAGPIRDLVAETVRPQRLQASVFGIAAGAAMLLLAVGVGGIVAASVRRRWREVGIRSALGASAARIVQMLVTDHLRPAAAGICAGLLAAWWMKEALRGLLYELDPGDLRLWAAAVAFITLVVVIAAWLPARRAAHADPAMVLRAE